MTIHQRVRGWTSEEGNNGPGYKRHTRQTGGEKAVLRWAGGERRPSLLISYLERWQLVLWHQLEWPWATSSQQKENSSVLASELTDAPSHGLTKWFPSPHRAGALVSVHRSPDLQISTNSKLIPKWKKEKKNLYHIKTTLFLGHLGDMRRRINKTTYWWNRPSQARQKLANRHHHCRGAQKGQEVSPRTWRREHLRFLLGIELSSLETYFLGNQ